MRLGTYEVLSAIGRGGAGTVFRARGPSGEVALKVLRPVTGDALARFDREVRLQGAFTEAEGFVPLLDAGESRDGPWLVMPLLSGGTLRDRLSKEGPLPVEETLALARSLTGALAVAHARGIVHRDLKPENVLFSGGRPLVADLGLAKHFRAEGQSVSLSLSGQIRGTAGYMAPEQMRDAKTVGPAADVFALGAILYECLAGEPPFVAENPVELLARVDSGSFLPLEERRPEVPRWLSRAVGRALAHDPEDRFEDAGALGRALAAEEPPAPRRWPVVLLVLGLALGALATTLRPGPQRAPDALTAPVLEEVARLVLAGDMRGAVRRIDVVLAKWPRDPELWHRRALLREGDDRAGALEDIARAIDLEPRNASHVLARASMLANGGDLAAALRDYDRGLALAPGDGDTWRTRGRVRQLLGDEDGALADYTRAIELDPRDDLSLVGRAEINLKRGRRDLVLGDAERLLARDPKDRQGLELKARASR